MKPCYQIDNSDEILSPSLVIFSKLVEANLDEMVRIAGGPERLRPHCKTHKTREITRLAIRRGITRHKCATFAEAEMLAEAGALDVFLAYNIVGPNIDRVVKFRRRFPDVIFSVTADATEPISELSKAVSAAKTTIDVLLDIDTGLHRTGVSAPLRVFELYQQIADAAGLRTAGLHLYDGHNHQVSREERAVAVDEVWNTATELRDQLVLAGMDVPKIVAGGTGSFPIFAEKEDPALELSPGTVVLHDAGYQNNFPDLNFTPAALLFTRVISRPTERRVTLDLGSKAVAADPPVEKRVVFPDIPDAKIVLQNEEHLVIETDEAERLRPGDSLLALPGHICPTTALHKEVYVVLDNRVVDTWRVVSRDRQLTI